MHVLFPDLYSPKEQVTTMMAGRVVPPPSRIENNRQIYIASQSVGLYSMHFLSTTPTVAIGFGNGKFNVHDLNTTKRCHTGQVGVLSLLVVPCSVKNTSNVSFQNDSSTTLVKISNPFAR